MIRTESGMDVYISGIANPHIPSVSALMRGGGGLQANYAGKNIVIDSVTIQLTANEAELIGRNLILVSRQMVIESNAKLHRG